MQGHSPDCLPAPKNNQKLYTRQAFFEESKKKQEKHDPFQCGCNWHSFLRLLQMKCKSEITGVWIPKERKEELQRQGLHLTNKKMKVQRWWSPGHSRVKVAPHTLTALPLTLSQCISTYISTAPKLPELWLEKPSSTTNSYYPILPSSNAKSIAWEVSIWGWWKETELWWLFKSSPVATGTTRQSCGEPAT